MRFIARCEPPPQVGGHCVYSVREGERRSIATTLSAYIEFVQFDDCSTQLCSSHLALLFKKNARCNADAFGETSNVSTSRQFRSSGQFLYD
jgi:hypothetical protein